MFYEYWIQPFRCYSFYNVLFFVLLVKVIVWCIIKIISKKAFYFPIDSVFSALMCQRISSRWVITFKCSFITRKPFVYKLNLKTFNLLTSRAIILFEETVDNKLFSDDSCTHTLCIIKTIFYRYIISCVYLCTEYSSAINFSILYITFELFNFYEKCIRSYFSPRATVSVVHIKY